MKRCLEVNGILSWPRLMLRELETQPMCKHRQHIRRQSTANKQTRHANTPFPNTAQRCNCHLLHYRSHSIDDVFSLQKGHGGKHVRHEGKHMSHAEIWFNTKSSEQSSAQTAAIMTTTSEQSSSQAPASQAIRAQPKSSEQSSAQTEAGEQSSALTTD
jgi:hypothetical protein